MPSKSTIIIQVRNPIGKNEPLPVVRVFDDVKMLRLKRAFFEDTLCQAAQLDGVDIKIAFAPRERSVWAKDAIASLQQRFPDESVMKSLSKRVEVIAQDVIPIGQRTSTNLRACLAEGYRNVVIMGGFLPTIPPQLLADAFNQMDDHQLILGPTIEGGCYLVGIRSDCADAADLVSIGTDTAYRDSKDALQAGGFKWKDIDLCYDVSHQEDLEYIVRDINHRRFTGDEVTGQCTESVLAEFIEATAGGDAVA